MELKEIFSKEVRDFSETNKLDGKQLEILKSFVDCRSGKIAKAICLRILNDFINELTSSREEIELM